MKRPAGASLVAGLILTTLALFLASCGPATPGAAPVVGAPALGGAALQSPIDTPTPTPPPSQPGPTPTRVPLCTPLAGASDDQPPAEESALDALAFGDPQVILTDTAPIDIAGWMPDGRNLLLVRQVPGQQAQAIESFDIRSGRTVRYAEAVTDAGQVFPLAQGQGVGFMDQAGMVEGQASPGVDLKVSHGPGQVQPVVRDVPFRAMAVDPASASLVRYAQAPGGPPVLPPQARQDFRVLTVPIDPYLWKYPTYFPNRVETGYAGDVFQVAVRPDGSMVAFYADPYLFLYDTRTERACEIDLGVAENGQPRFTWDARWSPDGRYLAMLTSARFPGELLPFADLTILDSLTGRTRTVNPSPMRLVDAFAWSSNSRLLILLGRLDQERLVDQLHLVDVMQGNTTIVLPQHSFALGISNSVSWTPANSNIALPCHQWPQDSPFITEQRVCLISARLGDEAK
jgi:hypothetical protein